MAQADADGGAGELWGEAHGRQHMAGSDLARGTRGARADRDARQIELDDQRLGAGPGQRQARRVGQARRTLGDDDRLWRDGANLLFQLPLQPLNALNVAEVTPRRFGCRAEARYGRDVLGAGAAAPLLSPAADEWRQGRVPTNDQRPRPLGAAELVRGQRQAIDAKFGHVDANAAGSLHGVG